MSAQTTDWWQTNAEHLDWTAIPGFPGYEASADGRIRSARPYGGQLRVLAQWPNRHGYLTVTVRVAGRTSKLRVTVHRLIAITFLGPKPNGLEVAHYDGVKTNNSVLNLRYATPSDNSRDQLRHGTHNNARKDTCKRGHKFDEANVLRRADRPNSRECRACRSLTKKAWLQKRADA